MACRAFHTVPKTVVGSVWDVFGDSQQEIPDFLDEATAGSTNGILGENLKS